MNIYAVFRIGVYCQGCGGIFSTAEKAEDAAKALMNVEPDDRHEFYVCKFDMDKTQILPTGRISWAADDVSEIIWGAHIFSTIMRNGNALIPVRRGE